MRKEFVTNSLLNISIYTLASDSAMKIAWYLSQTLESFDTTWKFNG